MKGKMEKKSKRKELLMQMRKIKATKRSVKTLCSMIHTILTAKIVISTRLRKA